MDNQGAVARINWGFAVFWALGILVWWHSIATNEQERSTLEIYLGSTVFVAFLVAHSAMALGASRSKEWARTGSIVLFIPILFAFPVGTLLAVSVIKKCRDWTTKTYNSSELAKAWPSSSGESV